MWPFKKRKGKTGLVLSSGGARGLAHIGAIKAIEESNVSIDMISGTSIGALVGACYAKSGNIRELEELALETDWLQLLQLADFNMAFMFKGFVHGKKVKELLETIIGDVQFSDLKIPLAVVATDIRTGEEVVLNKGSVIEAVRASISLPVVFMPVKLGDRFLIDGGLVNPAPANVLKDMGADFIIACNTIHEPAKTKISAEKKAPSEDEKRSLLKDLEPDKNPVLAALNNQIHTFLQANSNITDSLRRFIDGLKEKIPMFSQDVGPDTPGIFDVLMQAVYIMEYEIAKHKVQEADLEIAPDIGHISILEFNRAAEAILKGYEATKKALSKHHN